MGLYTGGGKENLPLLRKKDKENQGSKDVNNKKVQPK